MTQDDRRATFEQRLRRACISDPGIAIILEDWSRDQDALVKYAYSLRTQSNNVADAVFSDPVDMPRLESALRADAKRRVDRTLEQTEATIAVLKRLSPNDRAIYARDFTVMRLDAPASTKTCAPTR